MKKLKPNIITSNDKEIRVHELKVWHEFYDSLVTEDLSKRKTFEVRRNDRDYKVGDFLLLKDYYPKVKAYSDKFTWKRITYILNDIRFLPKDIIVLGIIDEIPNINIE